MKSVRRVQVIPHRAQIHERVPAETCLMHGTTERISQAVRQRGIEAHSYGWLKDGEFTCRIPILGNMDCRRLHEMQCVCEVLTERPTAVIVDNTNFVITKAINVVLVQKIFCIANQKVAYSAIPISKHEPACPTLIGEIKAVIVASVLLTVEEIEALVVEATTGVVINNVKDDRNSSKVQ